MICVIMPVIIFAKMHAIRFATSLDAMKFALQTATMCAIGFAELD